MGYFGVNNPGSSRIPFCSGGPGFEAFRRRRIGYCYLPLDLAQGGESFDSAQDRELVERLVEPFDIWDLGFGVFMSSQNGLSGNRHRAVSEGKTCLK